ncbi:MAG TPA: serine/threonine-protein kinase [Urbifossiella sp.]|nr:serine/threonine-protein kinase [Urbifossiella sp.]
MTDPSPSAALSTDEPPDDPLDFLEPACRPDAVGRLGHYEMLQLVGRGGFGIVFRAFDDVLQRVVAVKVLAPRLAAGSPARKRFVREARAYAGVRHENVVQVHAIEAEPIPYLVMEFIPGATLEALLAETGPLPAADVVRVGVQVARALAAAHQHGLIHRDVKPANILIEDGPESRVKLSDFGLARAADDASLTQSGQIAGTPMYMSPEQARGDTLDARSDLFSLGSVLYAMVTGRPPFRAANSMAVLKRVTDDAPRPVRDVIPEVPAGLCAVIERLHAKDPADRVQSAGEAAELLANCLGEPNVVKRRETPSPRGFRRPARLVAVAAGIVLGLLVAAFLARPAKPTAEPPPVAAAPDLADVLASATWGPPENLGPTVNTAGRELMATLTADECEIVFVRGAQLFTARRSSADEPFGPARLLSADPVQAPTLTGDGLVLMFAAGPGSERSEVHVRTRATRDEAFGPAETLPAPVNGGGSWAAAPVLSADGRTLLATRFVPGGPGKGDVVRFTRPARDAAFGGPELLPAPVSTAAFDAAAWVSDDGRVVVRTRMDRPPFETRFLLRGPEGYGPERAFAVPGMVGDLGRPWLSADGSRLYFHSRELPGGAGDLDLWVCRRLPRNP